MDNTKSKEREKRDNILGIYTKLALEKLLSLGQRWSDPYLLCMPQLKS